MRVGINTRFLIKGKMEGFGWYSYEIVKRLVQNHPEHTFYFYFDRPYDDEFLFGENVVPIVLSPKARHPILFLYWFEWKLKRAMKKHKIDLLFSTDGYAVLGSSVPQILTIHDINFEHNPEDLPLSARLYLRYFFSKFAKKAKKILTVSDYSKGDIGKTYGISNNKIVSVWNGASEVFQPIPENEKVKVRHLRSGGHEYFLFVGSLHPRKNITRLIEAYNSYLDEVKDPYHLVIVGEQLWKNNAEKIPLNDKSKSRVHFTGHLPLIDLAETMAAASVFTYVPYFEGFGIPLVEAMKCGVPIVSGDKTSLPEVAGDAALYCDPFDVNSIKQSLVKVSEDAVLREELSAKSLERGQLFSWDKAAKEVSQVLFND